MIGPDTWKGLEWDDGSWNWGVCVVKWGAQDGPQEEKLPPTSGWEFSGAFLLIVSCTGRWL